MRRTLSSTLAAAVSTAALLVLPSLGSAQVFTPSYLAPVRSSDVGIYLSEGPGDFAVEGIWRSSFGAYDLGLRGGLADTNDLSVLLGLDYRRPIALSAPIDLAATGSVQGMLGGADAAGLMAGLSIGTTLGSPGALFIPFVHPRVGLVAGDLGGDLELLADLGFDLHLSNLAIRFGLTIDDIASGWGVGLAWR